MFFKRSAIIAIATPVLTLLACLSGPAQASPPLPWVASWTASAHGPYPVGNPTAQPELKYAIPSADTGISDQSIRLIVRPDVWGQRTRIRLSNAFGTRPVTFDGAYVGLQSSGSALVPRTNRPVTFAGKTSVTVPPGQSVLSDAVLLPWVKSPSDPMLANRKLAVSFHVAGDSGPITWQAKAAVSRCSSWCSWVKRCSSARARRAAMPVNCVNTSAGCPSASSSPASSTVRSSW